MTKVHQKIGETRKTKKPLIPRRRVKLPSEIGSVLSCLREIAAIIDPRGRLLAVNPALCQFLKYREDDLLGQNLAVFLYDERTLERPPARPSGPLRPDHLSFPLRLVTREGARRNLQGRLCPLGKMGINLLLGNPGFEEDAVIKRFGITEKEAELLNTFLGGTTQLGPMAKHLGIQVTTVKTHMQNIYRKLRVKGKLELHQFLEPYRHLRRELPIHPPALPSSAGTHPKV